MVIALLLAAAASAGPVQLSCTLGTYQTDTIEPTARVEVLLTPGRRSGSYSVSFVDPDGRLGDRYGEVGVNRRRWSVRVWELQGRPTFFRLRSNGRGRGHAAQLYASRNESGSYTGHYSVNQGMLTESFAQGSSGPLACTLSPEAAQ